MSWVAVGVSVGTAAVGLYGAYQAQQQGERAYGLSKQMSEKALKLEQRKLAMLEERQERWNELFGPIEENLAAFYGSLTPEQLVSTGLQNQVEAFRKTIGNLETRAAQRGIETPALEAIKSDLELESARQRAEIRAEAPFKVAEAQSGFIRGFPDPTTQTANGMSGMANVYSQYASDAMDRAGQYGRQQQTGYDLIAQGIGQGAQAYGRYQYKRNQNQNRYPDPLTMNYDYLG